MFLKIITPILVLTNIAVPTIVYFCTKNSKSETEGEKINLSSSDVVEFQKTERGYVRDKLRYVTKLNEILEALKKEQTQKSLNESVIKFKDLIQDACVESYENTLDELEPIKTKLEKANEFFMAEAGTGEGVAYHVHGENGLKALQDIQSQWADALAIFKDLMTLKKTNETLEDAGNRIKDDYAKLQILKNCLNELEDVAGDAIKSLKSAKDKEEVKRKLRSLERQIFDCKSAIYQAL